MALDLLLTPDPRVTAFAVSFTVGPKGPLPPAHPCPPPQAPGRTSVVQLMVVLLILHRQVGLAAQSTER